jgi:hypothetical protein
LPIYGWILSICIFAYITLLVFKRRHRDILALALVAILCFTFGIRAVDKLLPGQDPVIYSTLISRVMVSDVSFRDLGVDYLLLYIIQLITRGTLSIGAAFMLIHLVYLIFIIPIYKFSRVSPGLFYLLSGWMMFANSGVLLLCNFLRQGYAILLFLGLILALSQARRRFMALLGALIMPALHASALILSPSLLLLRSRRYVVFYAAIFVTSIAFIWYRLPGVTTVDVEDPSAAASQLYLKVFGSYILLLGGYLVQRNAGLISDDVRLIERAAIGVSCPCAALLMLGTPSLLVYGLRFTYWIHAAVFLYLATVISSHKSELIFRISTLLLCVFGVITWSHPNVAMLLVW